jgi:membrane fusion protein, multidrug efflux system
MHTSSNGISKKILLLPTLAAPLMFLIACGNKEPVEAAAAGQRTAAPVVISTAEQRNIPAQISAIGNVEAYQTVQIRSQVNGQIENIFFKEGDDVKQGQLLFQLDKRPFRADLERALGTLQHDQAQAANSKAQSERYTALETQGVISREVAEQMRTQATADASAVAAGKAAAEAARVQLQYTDIAAPITARTGALLINMGNLVKANDTPFMVQLNQIAPIYVTYTVPESKLSEVRKFSTARRPKVLAYPKGQRVNAAEGELTFIDNGVDTQTGTVKLKATFRNQDRRLWPGEFVDVVMELSTHKNAIVVPTRAIQGGQQGDYVYVVTSDNKAESRPVQSVGTYQNLTLVSAGLKPGEHVIVDGVVRVAPNAPVLVQQTLPIDAVGATEAAAGAAGGGR